MAQDTKQQPTTQRFIAPKPLGAPLTITASAPAGTRTFANALEIRRVLPGNIGSIGTFPRFYDLGTPHLRTSWNVQTVTCSFQLSCIRFTSGLFPDAPPLKVTLA